MKTDDDEHKKCLSDKTKSDSALSKSKPLWISSNTKNTKSDQIISKTGISKLSCTKSKTTRNAISRNYDKLVGDQYKSPTRREEAPGSSSKIHNINNNIGKVTRSSPNDICNRAVANPEAWKFWMLNPKEPYSIKSINENTISKMPAPKSPNGSSRKETNKANKKASSQKSPIQQKMPGAPNPKQTVASKSNAPKPPLQKQLNQAKQSSSSSPKSTVKPPSTSVAAKPTLPDTKSSLMKSPAAPEKDTKGGKIEQVNLKSTQQIGKVDANNQGPTGKAMDIASDMKIPPKTEDSQKPKPRNPILTTLSENFNSTTKRGRANVSKVTLGLAFCAFLYRTFLWKPSEK